MVNEETKHDCNETHPDISHADWLDQSPEMEEIGEDEELEEIVDYDGSILSSKVPNNFVWGGGSEKKHAVWTFSQLKRCEKGLGNPIFFC